MKPPSYLVSSVTAASPMFLGAILNRITTAWRWTVTKQSLSRILNEKTQRLVNRGRTGLPVWLVILCDLFADVRTMIYPRDEVDRAAVLSMFQTCGYDWSLVSRICG